MAHVEAVEAVCLLEDTFPRSILTSQVHLLVHIIQDMAICGPVSSRWMFFLERFMKTLKDFVRQNAWPEGSMNEGWLIREGIVFISQYLHQVDSSMPHPFSIRHSLSTMDMREEDGPTVVPQGMGRSVNLGRELRAKMNNFLYFELVGHETLGG
jgi:hypothetical protein